MKKYILSLVCILSSAFAFGQGIHFEYTNLETALQKAKTENKVVFIDAYADWCGPCKMMVKDVFPDAELGAYFNENIVALKVNVEKGDGPHIQSKYKIEGLPGYVFIDGDGNVVNRGSGYKPVDKFFEFVKESVEYSKSPNNVGRMAIRYEFEKNDENFLKTYLEVLHNSKSVGYTDVLEQYLSIQTTLSDTCREMVMLLADHNKEIIFGGKADKIIQENLWTDQWNLYVRKEIRQLFQNLPENLPQQTTEYAISKKDSSYIELAFQRAQESGMEMNDARKSQVYNYFYLNAGLGEQYKNVVYPVAEEFIASFNFDEYRNYYMDWAKRKAEGDPKTKGVTPHAVRTSARIQQYSSTYARFMKTDEEKEIALRWAKMAYDLTPGAVGSTDNYANILYAAGQCKEAIELKERVVELFRSEKKGGALAEAQLQQMKNGENITL